MSFPDVDLKLVWEIYELIVKTVLCLGDGIVITRNRLPTEIVKSRFLTKEEGEDIVKTQFSQNLQLPLWEEMLERR